MAMRNLIAEGKLDRNVAIKSNDEIGELAASMNLISRNLKESFQKIEQYNRELLNQLYTDRLTHLANRRKLIGPGNLREPADYSF